MGKKNYSRCEAEMAQLREQSGLDENVLDKDGNQQSISNEVSGPSDHLFRTGEQLSIHGPTPFIPLEQRRRPGEQPGILEEQRFGPSLHYMSREQPSRHGPMHFIPLEPRQRPVEHPGRSEEQPFGHEEPLYRPGEHPNIHRETTFTPLEQRQRPGEHAGRTEELLFGPAEPLYISGDHLSRPQNDSGMQGTRTNVWDWISPSES